jgi:hypothetical protein
VSSHTVYCESSDHEPFHPCLPGADPSSPGNPVQWYVRCFQERRNFFFAKESVAQRNRYRTAPLAQLRKEKVRTYGAAVGSALREADWGARLDTPDWQVLERVQTEGSDLRLPELGPLHVLAAALQVRFRGEVAEAQWDDAIRTAKTMFALARHLGEHPTGAGNLTGLAIADLALNTLEEMVQQPNCPNLYWALTDLPCPLVDLRKGMQGDRARLEADLRKLREDVPMSDEEMEKVLGRLFGALAFAREQAGLPPRSLRPELQARVKDPEQVLAARTRLIEAGCPVVSALSFRPLQVILLDEKRDYEVHRDEAMKLLGLTPWQIDALLGPEASGREGVFAYLLPPVVKVRRQQGLLEQRIALLRHVEALRMYAAAHDGKLPGQLSEIAVPLPPDPFTGKPFAYRAEGNTAQLHGSPPRGEEQNPVYNLRYAVTLQKG